MKKLLVALSALFFSLMLHAQEFNEVGHIAAGMGGVGVAVDNNPYGLFYNPALLATLPGAKIGYSLGGNFTEQNLYEILKYDLNNIQTQDIQNINNILSNNKARIKGQATIVFQLPNLNIGQFAIGANTNVYANLHLNGNIAQNVTNINNAGLYFDSKSLKLTEIPIGYAYKFQTPAGDVSTGIAIKYINATFGDNRVDFDSSFDTNRITSTLKDRLRGRNSISDTNFGIDLGASYKPISNVNLGLVLKNINSPSFNFAGENLKLKPQARVGASVAFWDATIAADADLTTNDAIDFSNTNLKSQKIGLGVDYSLAFFGVRAGVAKDLKIDNGAILSAGIGFGILEFSAAVSTQTADIQGKSIPRYIAFQLGGGFLF